jgi:hypothetical protein
MALHAGWRRPITITGDGRTVRCRGGAMWNKIVSERSVFEGASRWQILVEFENKRAGWMAIGVTLSGAKSIPLEEMNWLIGSPVDVMACTAQDPASPCFRRNIVAFERNGVGQFLSEYKSHRLKSVAFIELSLDYQFMRIEAQGNEGEANRRLALPLQLAGKPIDVNFRPCVFLSGFVSATILPSPEE